MIPDSLPYFHRRTDLLSGVNVFVQLNHKDFHIVEAWMEEDTSMSLKLQEERTDQPGSRDAVLNSVEADPQRQLHNLFSAREHM